jgi:polyhydroxyalkanoate synthesis regulator phasin
MFESVPNLSTLRNYLEMATGLTEASAAKAMEVAGSLIAQGMSLGTKQPADMASSVAQAADDLMAQSKTNRDLLIGLIRTEVDKAIGRVGFVREDELAALRARVEKVEFSIAAGEGETVVKSQDSRDLKNSPEAENQAPPIKKKKKVVVEHES